MIESTVLGHRVDYPQHYAPEILVAVPRHLNRKIYGLEGDKLPFVGYDTWHAYEISFLTETGLPVVGVMKMVYDAHTENLVESKSLKLYLNSFNMEKYGCNAIEGYEIVANIIKDDISKCVSGDVEVCIFAPTQMPVPSALSDYMLLEDMPWANDIVISNYSETPDLLKSSGKGGIINVMTHLLRSNCKITHQPDWGTAFIYMNGKDIPTEQSILEYLVSIRGENHFHEEICEMIFTRIWRMFHPDELMVTCIYTRRGGIDICPMRATSLDLLPNGLREHTLLTDKLLRQ